MTRQETVSGINISLIMVEICLSKGIFWLFRAGWLVRSTPLWPNWVAWCSRQILSRWTIFFLVLLLGLGLGLVYGWVINPVSYQDTTLTSLRIDYKTDFTLMVAEVYHQEGDLDWALNRLTLLEDKSPVISVDNALLFASQSDYTLPDMFLLRDLSNALKELD